VRTVILAAGLGSRLGPMGEEMPKGLLAPGGEETLIQRSHRLLVEAGLGPVTLVVGHRAEVYRALPEPFRFVENPEYASTGSLRSLLLAFAQLQDDLLVLESDLIYEPRALQALLGCDAANAILTSGFTEAGDEVYVDAPGGRLRSLSKQRDALLGPANGEFVGICRFSRLLLEELERWGTAHPAAHYESDGVVALCDRFEVATVHVPDLVWQEVDDPEHWERCQKTIFPRLRGRSTEGVDSLKELES
jgi:choline kinase